MDKFTNNLGIVFGSICALVVVGWITGRRNKIQQHLNAVSHLKVSGFWQVLTFIATPLLLIYFLVNEIITIAREGYEGYSSIQIGLFGWAVLGIILLVPRTGLLQVRRQTPPPKAQATMLCLCRARNNHY